MAAPRWLNETEFRAWIGYRRMRLLLDAEVGRDLMRTSGLSMPDYDVLSVLSNTKGHRQWLTSLAARMLWSKSRVSRHISRMETRGLVTRAGDAADGRRADVVLTDEGMRAIVEAAPDHVESVRKHFIDLLTEEQLRMLGDVAEIVLADLSRPDVKEVWSPSAVAAQGADRAARRHTRVTTTERYTHVATLQIRTQASAWIRRVRSEG